MKINSLMISAVLLCLCLSGGSPSLAQEKGGGPHARPSLIRAVMCEGTKDYVAQNPAVVFSVVIGRVLCFTDFDPVPEKTIIYHNWFFRDRLITKIGLSLQPPRWSTFSSIQLREADKGPWRVIVTDQEGQVYQELRFSITD
jgi:hypothetical protein